VLAGTFASLQYFQWHFQLVQCEGRIDENFLRDDQVEVAIAMNRSSNAVLSEDDIGSQMDLDWSNNNDPEIPFNWSLRTKWTITLTTCFVCFAVGLNATCIASAPTPINERFGISDAHFPNSFWPVASWTVGAAIMPMVILPLMESYGVRPGYLLSYAVFTIFVIPQAVAMNFSTLIACRFFAGSAAGVLQNGMDGIIADIWRGATQRSLPVTIYVTGLLAGVSLGPVFGGVIVHNCYWRWIFYIQLVIYGITFCFVILIMKETRGPVINSKRTRTSRNKEDPAVALENSPNALNLSPARFLYDTVILPAYLLCTEPVVFFFTLLSALSYGVVFISTQSVTQVFTTNYSFTEYQAGLVQVSMVIGELLGFVACVFQNEWYAHVTKSNPNRSEAELSEIRLYFSIPASFIGLTGGLFFYGWTSYPFLPWILPAIGLGFVGFGVTVVMQAIMMYVTDSYAKYAASASAAVCFGENIFAAFLPLAAQSMYTKLGYQWASSVLAFIALLLSFAPIILVWKGKQIRGRSPFMRKAMYGE
jgi:MFS family permease